MAYGYNNRDFKDANVLGVIVNFVAIACLMAICPVLALFWIFLVAPHIS